MNAKNSAWWESVGSYVLGLDLGPSSLGWAVLTLDDEDRPCRIVQAGVRRFEAGVLGDIEGGRDESRATERRDARGPRRQHWRRQWRMRKLFRVLTSAGLLPASDDDSPDARHALLLALDAQLRAELAPQQDRAAAHVFPYYLRAQAIERPLPIFAVGRALYHLAQRRGFLSNRKTARGDEDEGKVRSGIIHLQDEMQLAGVATLGQYFAGLDPEEQRIRARWTSRHMYLDEFERIWNRQAKEHPAFTDELKAQVYAAMFDQRPLKSQKGLIGRCELEADKRRAPLACLAAQRFRIAQRVNDLRVTAPDGEVRELTRAENQTLVAALQTKAELSWAAVKKLPGFIMKKSREYGANWVFNMEEGGDKRIVGNRTAEKMANTLGDAWLALTPVEQNQLVDEMISFESEDALAQRLVSGWKLPLAVAHAASQLVFEQGTASHSRKAIGKLLPRMEQGVPYSTARKAIYGESFQAGKTYDELPPVKPTNKEREGALRELRNPAVERAMSELRKVVNAVIARCGQKPKIIRVELTRDLKHNRQRRKEMTDRRDRNTDTRDKARKRILEEMGERYATPINILKVRLADECGWICPFTGKQIGMTALVGDHPQFDIEHIIPFSRSLDNSFINKTLCHYEENRNRKRNNTPYEAYHGSPQYDEIIQRVKRFNSDVRAKKLALFQTEGLPDDKDFSDKLLSDTRYISRLASQFLGLLYGGKLKIDDEGKLRVQVSPGRATAYLRQRWNLNSIIGHDDEKNRDDHRHHAIDAIVIALTDSRTVQLLAHAAEEAEDHGETKLFADVDAPWATFMDEARAAIERINVSSRVSRKLNGPLHKDTILSKPRVETDENGKQVEVHCVRKRLDAMSAQEVEAIVDPRVRQLVQARLKALGGTPQQAFKDTGQHPHLTAKDGRIIPIHKARIRKPDRPMPVGQGSNRRYVNPGSNHHMEIVAVLDAEGREKKWEGILVSRFDAVQRRKEMKKSLRNDVIQRDHGPGKTFKFSLAGGEYVVLESSGEALLLRVTVISEGRAEFLLHADARPITVRKKIAGARIHCSPDAMRKANARKVIVDPLGDIHPRVINRILDFSESPARLSVRHKSLVVEPPDQQPTTMPLSDIAVLVVSHPQVHYTHAVLAGLAECGGIFITCGPSRLPVGMLLPLDAHFTQAERFAAQASAAKPLKKRLWQQIVRAKVLAQARLLAELHGSDCGLALLAPQVRSCDPSNIEARAARQYWQMLFADEQFRRDRDVPDQNRLLNYGYAVLRAIVARSICSVGLHPALGVHHHNRYSSYPLADDLMEPLRPAVDRAVVELVNQYGDTPSLSPEVKRQLLTSLMGRFPLDGEERTLFDVAARTASSLADCFLGNCRQLCLPEV